MRRAGRVSTVCHGSAPVSAGVDQGPVRVLAHPAGPRGFTQREAGCLLPRLRPWRPRSGVADPLAVHYRSPRARRRGPRWPLQAAKTRRHIPTRSSKTTPRGEPPGTLIPWATPVRNSCGRRNAQRHRNTSDYGLRDDRVFAQRGLRRSRDLAHLDEDHIAHGPIQRSRVTRGV
jgi:hypothetical protein